MVTANLDFALISVWLFFLFFFFLIVYLRRGDKREGYPLLSDRSEHVVVQGWPAMPPPKHYAHAHPARGPVKLPGKLAIPIAIPSVDAPPSAPDQPETEEES
jgi:photosynthetic reaction center H subunit